MGKAKTAQGEKKTMPLISVIMGVHNSDSDMLLSAVRSVLSQSVSDIELIICDDGSENDIEKMLDGIKDSRVKLIFFKENKGLAAALNACIDVASGKYIARQDDDDISLPGRFEKQTEYLENHGDTYFIGTDCELYSQGEGVYGERIMPKTVDKRSFLFNSPFIHGSMMFRREVFDKERYRTLGKNRKYEDYDLFMRLCADGFKSANLPEKLYRFHYDRSTRRVSFSMRCDEFKVRTEGFKRLGLMPVGFFYALKPILLGFIPRKAMIKLKEKTTGV